MTKKRWSKGVCTWVAVCFVGLQFISVLPEPARADAGQDLKTIEYKYYFRGNYDKAITELRAFLERSDLEAAQVVEAKEYLAASLILSGNTELGRAQYIDLLKMDGTYQGPDPSVFKSVIVATFEEAKAEYASVVINAVPPGVATGGLAGSESAATSGGGKPFYKKWWFYATMGVVVLAVAGAASGSGDDSGEPADRGSVAIDVAVP